MISRGADLDSSNAELRFRSENLYRQEVHWATHMGLTTIYIPCPDYGPVFNFARVVNNILGTLNYSQAVIRITLRSDMLDSWNKWNIIRTMCDSNPKLFVALDIQSDLSDAFVDKTWQAEPVKGIFLNTAAFLRNKKGFPVLSKRLQAFLKPFFELDTYFILSAQELPSDGLSLYRQYLQHLHKNRPEPDEVEKFAQGYHDYLQSPLQPLMDNLESATYEVFERDPVKYSQYEKAIGLAIADSPLKFLIVMVVGAGRGPLVDCALRAADANSKKILVYAVEKNPNAIVILKQKKEAYWKTRVNVYHADMRYWKAPEKCDILVSELLGSFGDNELSPECLDGAQVFLKENGVSIPSKYTAFAAPLSSSKIYSEVCAYKDVTHVETPYVVKFKAVDTLGLDPVALWSFEHPLPADQIVPRGNQLFNSHNTRYGKASFQFTKDVLIHGIAGYFDAILYKDVTLSIHPQTHSPGMFSWFPLFFPLKTPTFAKKGDLIELHFWRLTDSRKVWYEWAAVPVSAPTGENQGIYGPVRSNDDHSHTPRISHAATLDGQVFDEDVARGMVVVEEEAEEEKEKTLFRCRFTEELLDADATGSEEDVPMDATANGGEPENDHQSATLCKSQRDLSAWAGRPTLRTWWSD
ncbi:Protein arginine N-methyltransferase 5 [Phlyctochytrium planicorne]|nr:Protein arginine N-methyltransferase 5 [Phlyctochytrium planicorne]